MKEVEDDRREDARSLIISPSEFLLEVCQRAIGSSFRPVVEEQDGSFVFPGGQLSLPGVEFVRAVERHLEVGPVLAVPRWERPEDHRRRVVGQELIEQVGLCDHPLGLLVPLASVTGREGSTQFREALLRQERSLFIVEMEGVLGGVHPRFRVALIVLVRESIGTQPLARFVRVSPNVSAESTLDDIKRLARMPGGSKPSGFVHRGSLDPHIPLTYQQYDPVLRSRRGELGTWGSATRLGDLYEISRPEPQPKKKWTRRPGRFITGRSIRRGGILEVSLDDESLSTLPVSLRASDLVMQSLFAPTMVGGLLLAEVQEKDVPVEAIGNLIILRPDPTLSEAERLLLLHYLRSDLVKELVLATGTQLRLEPSLLENLDAPRADEALLEAVRSIVEADFSLRSWAQEARGALDSIVDLRSPREARDVLIERGRKSRLRAEAARQVDDFDHRVRTLYPYPIAYRWRSLDSLSSKGEAGETLRDIRHGFEHILAFCGCLAAALAHDESLDLPELGRFGAEDGYKTFLTTWTTMLNETRSKVHRGRTDNPLLIRLGTLLDDQSVLDSVHRLSEHRRAESHTLSSSGDDELARRLKGDVETLVRALDFLADYELVEVVETRWDRIRKRNDVKYRAFVGDHPIVPVRSITLHQAEIEKGSLYIRPKHSKEFMVLLRPYLIGRRCPDCSNWGTFYLHEIRGESAVIKSIEFGHAHEMQDLPGVFRALAVDVAVE